MPATERQASPILDHIATDIAVDALHTAGHTDIPDDPVDAAMVGLAELATWVAVEALARRRRSQQASHLLAAGVPAVVVARVLGVKPRSLTRRPPRRRSSP